MRSFAGPLGIEDASRTEVTRNLVIAIEYPTHGALRANMYRAFRLAGLHSRWDDFVNDTLVGSHDPVDQCPVLYMDDKITKVTERLATSMLEAEGRGIITVFFLNYPLSRVLA